MLCSGVVDDARDGFALLDRRHAVQLDRRQRATTRRPIDGASDHPDAFAESAKVVLKFFEISRDVVAHCAARIGQPSLRVCGVDVAENTKSLFF